MLQHFNNRFFKYPTVQIAAVGGVVLMSLVAALHSISFGFEKLTLLSLLASFLFGSGATFCVVRMLQKRLNNLRQGLADEFSIRSSELRNTEDRFNQYAETSKAWFWETDVDNRFVFLSSHMYEVSGAVPEEVLGHRREDFRLEALDRDEEEQWEKHLGLIEQRLPFSDFCYRSRTSDGWELMYRSSGKPFFDSQGDFLGYRGSALDATEEIYAADQKTMSTN